MNNPIFETIAEIEKALGDRGHIVAWDAQPNVDGDAWDTDVWATIAVHGYEGVLPMPDDVIDEFRDIVSSATWKHTDDECEPLDGQYDPGCVSYWWRSYSTYEQAI